jgi:hypothetical protein
MEQLIKDHIALWNERSPSARRAKVDDIFGADATYVDPLADARGPAAFDTVIDALQAQFAGASLAIIGPPDAHHRQARFTWGLGPADGEPVVIGFDVLVAGDDGRIASVYGFIDKGLS